MIAIARLRLDTTTQNARDSAGQGDAEIVDVPGPDSADWDAAMTATRAILPEGAQLLSWHRGE